MFFLINFTIASKLVVVLFPFAGNDLAGDILLDFKFFTFLFFKITEEDLRLFFSLLALDLETLRRFKFVLFANPPFA